MESSLGKPGLWRRARWSHISSPCRDQGPCMLHAPELDGFEENLRGKLLEQLKRRVNEELRDIIVHRGAQHDRH